MRTIHLAVFSFVVGAVSSAAAQPSLTPPLGPVSESGRFGHTIELNQSTAPGDANSVFKISAPGSYVLTEDLSVPGGRIGIEINSDDISIDLNGYSIRGADPATSVGISVNTDPGPLVIYRNLRVTNGVIRSANYGINLIITVGSGFNVEGTSVDTVRFEAVDIGVEGNYVSVRDCDIRASDIGLNISFAQISNCRFDGPGTGAEMIAVFASRVGDCNFTLFQNDTAIRSQFSQVRDCSITGLPSPNSGIDDRGNSTYDNVHISTSTGFERNGNDSVVRNCTYFGATPAAGPGTLNLLTGNNF